MGTLIQTQKYSIIYGDFRDKKDQELFRCPRELDEQDLRRYINENREFVGFEDDDTEDLRNVEGKVMVGYWRMYFRGGWAGRWMLENGEPSQIDCLGVNKMIDWFCENFDKGCDYFMKEYMTNYKKWGGEHRYLLRPKYSDVYKVMVDTTYGNGDYPVRIYVYKNAVE